MLKIEIFGIPYLKKGNEIHIKKKNRGKFTEYCGGKVTDECISRAKKSKNPKLRKRATFAANARKWKHEKGGSVHKPNGHKSILDNGWLSTKLLKKPLVNKALSGTSIELSKELSKEQKKKLVKRALNPTGPVNRRPTPGFIPSNRVVAQNDLSERVRYLNPRNRTSKRN